MGLDARPSTHIQHMNTYILTRPRSLIVGGLNVQTGPELRENRRRQAFGEDVGVLRTGRNMENADVTYSNTLPNKM